MTARRRNTKAGRIADRLRADLQARAFGDAQMLPTEARLCERYGASRETVRKSLRALIAEGLLTRLPNRGVSRADSRDGRREPERLHIDVLTPFPFKTLNYYYHGILTGLVAGSHELGVALSFVTRHPATDLLAATAAHPTILWPAEPCDLPELRRLVRAERRFVVMSASFADAMVPAVDCDNASGAHQAIDCLVRHGHRRIGLVARSRRISLDHAQRIIAAKQRLRRDGLPVDAGSLFLPDDAWSATEHDRAFGHWMKTRRTTAVFALDLDIAGRVYAFAEARRVTVPDQLSLVAFDDSELAEVYAPTITAVAQPLADIARRALERLVQAAAQGQLCRGTERLPTRLVERESVAPPRRRTT